jgi:hypothetical protein
MQQINSRFAHGAFISRIARARLHLNPLVVVQKNDRRASERIKSVVFPKTMQSEVGVAGPLERWEGGSNTSHITNQNNSEAGDSVSQDL